MDPAITIPVGWVLGIITALGAVISTLAITLWQTMKSRLEKQDQIIEKLQEDIDRLSHGCGHADCLWKSR